MIGKTYRRVTFRTPLRVLLFVFLGLCLFAGLSFLGFAVLRLRRPGRAPSAFCSVRAATMGRAVSFFDGLSRTTAAVPSNKAPPTMSKGFLLRDKKLPLCSVVLVVSDMVTLFAGVRDDVVVGTKF